MQQPQTFNYEEAKLPQMPIESADSIIKPITLLALGAAGAGKSHLLCQFAGSPKFPESQSTDKFLTKQVDTYSGYAFNNPDYKFLNLIDTPPCDEIIRDNSHLEKIKDAIQSKLGYLNKQSKLKKQFDKQHFQSFRPTILGLLFVYNMYDYSSLSRGSNPLKVLIQFTKLYPHAKVFLVYTHCYDNRLGDMTIKENIKFLNSQGVSIARENVIFNDNKPQSLQIILEILKEAK